MNRCASQRRAPERGSATRSMAGSWEAGRVERRHRNGSAGRKPAAEGVGTHLGPSESARAIAKGNKKKSTLQDRHRQRAKRRSITNPAHIVTQTAGSDKHGICGESG